MEMISDNSSTMFKENTTEILLQYEDQIIVTEEKEAESQGHIC